MKTLTVLVMLGILLAGLVLLGLNDTRISVADSSIPDNKTTTSQAEANNSSASTTITITMTGVLTE